MCIQHQEIGACYLQIINIITAGEKNKNKI
jgi:hypothetical protein